jgi:transcriptional regulator with PAS, ATPase and Fis domain
VKLLRVLEDRSFTKVGGQQSQKFDIRIVAATNKSIETLTDGKSFRLDLFHRLGTFIIHLPALRERQSDIPLLAK